MRLGADRAMAVCGSDPAVGALCEISISGPTYIAEYDAAAGEPRHYTIAPADLGLRTYQNSAALTIGSPEQSARLIERVLAASAANDGEGDAAGEIVIANAAAALWVGGATQSLGEGVGRTREAIKSGAARVTLDTLIECSHGR